MPNESINGKAYLYVLFGMDSERYPGEEAPEALAVCDEFAMCDGGEEEYMQEQREKYSKDYKYLDTVLVEIDFDEVRKALLPRDVVIPGKVLPKEESDEEGIN